MEYNDYPPNTTPISSSDMNDLPSLEKFIRTPHNREGYREHIQEQHQPHPQHQPQPSQQDNDTSMVMYHPNPNTSSCIEFYEHVKSCPICSKFYNNDNSLYIIIIVLMIIVIIILLKKILKV